MPNDNPQTTDNSLEWFAENLPAEYLSHPEYFLYSTALDVEQMQDIPENRRRFKKLLVERQLSEGIELPEIDQKQLHDFMNPKDKELKLQRSEELLELTTRHLEQTQDFAQAQCLAVLELFHREAPFRQAEMDESYFRNREFVEADLRGFLKQAEGDSLKSLHTENPKRDVSIQTQSGEQIAWRAYLDHASGALFYTKKRTDNPHRPVDALKSLLQIAGVDIIEYIPMDEKYFNNSDYVKADLTAYLQHAEGDSLADLHTNNPKSNVSIQTLSGQRVTWDTYLNRASGVLFDTKRSQLGKKSKNPHRPPHALRALLKIAGAIPEFIPMDEAYFNNPDYVKADLIAYLHHSKCKLLKDLSTYDPKLSSSIQTQSGEQVKWITYLRRASDVLLGTTYKKENPHRPYDALKALLKIADESVSEYKPMDKEYFNNSEIVKADLSGYLQRAKGDSLKDLHTDNPEMSIAVQIQSGEQVKWQTYLSRASSVLLGTRQGNKKKKSNNPHRRPEALKLLKQIALQAGVCNDPMTPRPFDFAHGSEPSANDQSLKPNDK